MDILDQLLTLPNLVFCLFIAVLVWLERQVVEKVWKNAGTNKLWNELALPMSGVVLGAGLAVLVKMYPFPSDFTSTSGRLFFGAVMGLISSHAFKILKGLLKKKEVEAEAAEAEAEKTSPSKPDDGTL